MRVTRACLTDSVVVCLLLLSAVLTPAITSAALISPNSRQRSDLSSQALSHPPPPALDLPSQSTNTDRHSPSSDHRSVIGDSRSLTTGEAIGVSRSEEKFPGENWRQQTLSANGADISDVNGNTRKSNEGNPLPMQGNFRRRNSWRQREPPNGEYGRPDTQPSQKGSSMASNDTSFSRNNNENFKQNRKNAVACASCKEQPYFSEDSPQLSELTASETEAVSNTYGNSSVSDRMMGDDPRIRATKGGASTRSATKSKGLSASGDSQGSLLPKVQSPYSARLQQYDFKLFGPPSSQVSVTVLESWAEESLQILERSAIHYATTVRVEYLLQT
ncbi:hypothetical protein PoB_004686200 [Plakobranchus ocellatus]|uniref:Uncharacterized protein n=1 Tax=Plakobranchus ocellatus TaxID=259542 RepID=A0AAV4BN53_9GAST|nr:hypothetical protein PoB_004686200 [Plakobranchus ocellatus]